MSVKNAKKNLTGRQAAAVEAYRQRLAETVPEVEILDAFATDGIIEVKLNDASARKRATGKHVVKLPVEVEDQFKVTLPPYVVPHEN